MTTAQDKIIDKIRKLLALAERGGTEAEAELAMAKVQELLTEHNLEIDAVRGKEEVTMTREYKEYAWNQSWIREVYSGVSRLYFCKFYYTPNGTTNQWCYLIGEPVNIQTAQYVIDVVIATGQRLAKQHATQAREEFLEWCTENERKDATGVAISASNNFKKGFATRINQRCWELRSKAMQKKDTTRAPGNQLVVADFYKKNEIAIAGYMDQIGLKLGRGAGMGGATNNSSFDAGGRAANSVNLQAGGVGRSSGALLLGGKK